MRAELGKIQAFQKAELKKGTIPETLYAFFKQLQPEEQTVLRILFNTPHALSVRQIKKAYMFQLALTYPETTTKNPLLVELKTSGVNSIREDRTKFYNKLKDIIRTERDAESFISFFNKNAPEKVPAYYKIKNTLEYFEKEGLCGKRALAEQKAEEIWFLSPIFSKIYFIAINALEQKQNAGGSTELERKTHLLLTGMWMGLSPSESLRESFR